MEQTIDIHHTRIKENRFILLYILTLAISFSPYTQIGQISALFFFVGIIFFVGIRPVYHIKKIILIILLYLFAGLMYWVFLQNEFWFVSYFLFLATISSFLIFIFDFKPIANVSLIRKVGLITLVVIFLEAAYGIFQAIYIYMQRGAIGDMVWGTLGPTNNHQYIGRMPHFIILLSTLLIFTIGTSSLRVRYQHLVIVATVALCWILAKLMHSYVYFFLAAVIAVFLLISRKKITEQNTTGKKSNRRRNTLGLGIVFLTIIIFAIAGSVALPGQFARIPEVISDAVDISPNSRYIKMKATYDTLFILPKDEWIQPLIGIGPGQYASRAALMVSGEYLERSSIPLIPNYVSTYAQRYIISRLGVIGSSLHLPTSSWIAWYGEMGLIGLLILTIVLIKGIRFFRSYSSPVFPRMSFFMLILLLYILFMGIQNVYWEYTQAIFPAVLGLKLSYDYLKKEKETSL